MNPGEKIMILVLFDPWEDFFIYLMCMKVPSVGRHSVIVNIKTMMELEMRLEDPERYEGRCFEAFFPEQLCQRRFFLFRPENLSVVVKIEEMRRNGIKQGSMCRSCDGDQAVTVFTQDSFLGKEVNIRSF